MGPKLAIKSHIRKSDYIMKRILLAILSFFCAIHSLSAQYDRDVFYFRGRTALSDGKYAQAIENFNILAQLDSSDYWTFFYRGIAKYNLGDIRGAQQDFDASVRINPVFTNGYHYRAITESRFGRYDEAFRDFDKALSLRPGNIGLYFSRGVTHFLAQQFDEAVKDFDRYIKVEPEDPAAFLNRGASHLYLKDTLKAINDYNRAIELDRFDPEGYIRRGRLHADMKEYELAIADLDHAIQIDSTNTSAYFNRALMHYDRMNYNEAMRDLNRVLKDEPGNALTLYNRSLINAQIGNYEEALEDMDRVININPRNVLAYYNRASFFIEMGRWRDALDDYDTAIELYPDFAKAYLNRSYVNSMLGRNRESKEDYQTAQKKIKDYRDANSLNVGSFADTTKKYSSLIALDADFAKKDFDDELLQHRDIDIKLKKLYKFNLASSRDQGASVLKNRYENNLVERFIGNSPVPVTISNNNRDDIIVLDGDIENALYGDSSSGAGAVVMSPSQKDFIKGLYALYRKQYNAALDAFDNAADISEEDLEIDNYSEYYRAFYLMNRGVLRADMIEFIASIQSNVQTLTMDDQGSTRARVNDRATYTYDYSEAIEDMEEAAQIVPDIPYIHYNLGNLHTLSSQLIAAIEDYDRAIKLYPYMGDAYFNRGLVLIYLKDKEKGCIDLSRAGELGVSDAYSVISKYCEDE